MKAYERVYLVIIGIAVMCPIVLWGSVTFHWNHEKAQTAQPIVESKDVCNLRVPYKLPPGELFLGFSTGAGDYNTYVITLLKDFKGPGRKFSIRSLSLNECFYIEEQ